MAAKTTVQCDAETKEKLEVLKRKYGDDTYDTTLRRLVGLLPEPDEFDKISTRAASVNEEAEVARDRIRAQFDFREVVKEEDNRFKLLFEHPEHSQPIVEMKFENDAVNFFCINETSHTMEKVGMIENSEYTSGTQFGPRSVLDHYDAEKFGTHLQKEVRRALRSVDPDAVQAQ